MAGSSIRTHPRRWRTPPARAALLALLTAALAAVAVLTLTPQGSGWAWGSPVGELRWYATGLDSAATLRQCVGNLGLLVVPAALAVLLWPRLGRPRRLTAVSLAAGSGIELLQWALSLGRVVSPLDALLNASGAVLAGLLVTRVGRSAPGSGPRRPSGLRRSAPGRPARRPMPRRAPHSAPPRSRAAAAR